MMKLIAASDDVEKAFGKITPPPEIKTFTDKGGAGGISMFLSNLITLFYSLAAIVLLFMLLWGAFDWITSEGDKEKLASARNKIISAIIGIMLFGITFAVIQVLGTFTGFTFFEGQNNAANKALCSSRCGTQITCVVCPNKGAFCGLTDISQCPR